MSEAPSIAVERKPLSVSALTRQIKGLLEREINRVWVEGEVSNFKRQPSGHWYFSLKDASTSIRGVMFRNKNRWVDFDVENGLAVRVQGKVTVYERAGNYQVVVERLEPVGLGALQARFDALKKKLAAEQLFDRSRKKPLPFLPSHVGLVTSKSGAALRDMLKVLRRRRPHLRVTLVPVRVQGAGSASEVATAVRRLNEDGQVEVIIVGRGGGSLEDLWAFNEEIVARSIAASRIPVVSGVGHETDFTIADFVADARAPTPSAAAETVIRVTEAELSERVCSHQRRLLDSLRRAMQRREETVAGLQERLRDPRRIVQDFRLRTDELSERVSRAQRAILQTQRAATVALERSLRAHRPTAELTRRRERLRSLERSLAAAVRRAAEMARARFRTVTARLDNLSPLTVLGRGYAIAQDADSGRVIRRADDVQPGQQVRVRVGEGEFRAVVGSGKRAKKKTDDSDPGQGMLPI